MALLLAGFIRVPDAILKPPKIVATTQLATIWVTQTMVPRVEIVAYPQVEFNGV